MIVSPYIITSTATGTTVTLHRAIATSGGNYTDGDILLRRIVINSTTGAVTNTVWENLDTETILGAAPASADIEAVDGFRIPLTSETVTIDGTVGGIALTTIPTTANHAEIHVWDADISFTVDGTTAPTATIGVRQSNGSTFELECRPEITGFKGIRLSGTSARIYVQYFKTYGDNRQS